MLKSRPRQMRRLADKSKKRLNSYAAANEQACERHVLNTSRVSAKSYSDCMESMQHSTTQRKQNLKFKFSEVHMKQEKDIPPSTLTSAQSLSSSGALQNNCTVLPSSTL